MSRKGKVWIYLDIDCYFYNCCRKLLDYPEDTIVVNYLGYVISVPYHLQEKGINKMMKAKDIEPDILNSLSVCYVDEDPNTRSLFYRVAKKMWEISKGYYSKAQLLKKDSILLFIDSSNINEFVQDIKSQTGFDITIGYHKNKLMAKELCSKEKKKNILLV